MRTKENPFSSHLDEVEEALREGITTEELEEHGGRRVAPGITVEDYLETLGFYGNVEEVDGRIRWSDPSQATSS